MKYEFTGDYKAKFAQAVDELWATPINAKIGDVQSEIKQRAKDGGTAPDLQAFLYGLSEGKRRLSGELTEAYVEQTGKRPDPRQLDRLATWLLKGAEHDDAEADVLTASQQKRRRKRELPDALIEDKSLVDDGNRHIEAKPSMDEGGARFEFIRFPNDNADKREFNGHVTKYRT